jgi:hypothetical protein
MSRTVIHQPAGYVPDEGYECGLGAMPAYTGTVGGGLAYDPADFGHDRLTRRNADTVVPYDKSFDRAIETACDGERIFVVKDVETNGPVLTADGVHLGSDRGVPVGVRSNGQGGTHAIGEPGGPGTFSHRSSVVCTDGGAPAPSETGASGAIIKSNGTDTHGLQPEGVSDLLVTGLRWEGDNWPDPSNARVPDDDAGSAALYLRDIGAAECANNEMYGWRWAGILHYSGDGPLNAHHCHQHGIPRQGFGYGIAMATDASTTDEARNNYLNLCRHSLKGNECSYNAVNNIQGPKTANHMFDVHSPASGDYLFRNNTFLTDRVTDYSPRDQPAINIRDVPGSLLIEANQFEHSDPGDAIWLEVGNDGNYRWPPADGFEDVTTVNNNTFGGETKEGVGAQTGGSDTSPTETGGTDGTDGTSGGQ